MTIQVEFFDDENRMEISWNSEDPIERGLNDFTEEQFLEILMNRANEILNQ